MHFTFLMTEQCTARCAHCAVNSSPEATTTLPPSLICRVIDELIRIPAAQKKCSVCFSGGEPLLHRDTLIPLIEYATSKGIAVSCVTNCFWATSEHEALQCVRALHRAGLQAMGISCDPFHGGYISSRQIRYAALACKQCAISLEFKNVITTNSPHVYAILKELDDIITDSVVSVNQMRCVPLGRAKQLPHDIFLYQSTIPSGTCAYMAELTVAPTGDVYPCCVPDWASLLRLGNVHTQGLPDIVNTFYTQPVLNILNEKGPVYFVSCLEKKGIRVAGEKFVNECHLCNHVLTLLSAMPDVFTEATKMYQQEIAQEHTAAAVALHFGET